MGADGGVITVQLKKPGEENRVKVNNLLRPFWQFLCQDGLYYAAEDALHEWYREYRPSMVEIVGVYGTDRGDFCDLCDLRDLVYTILDEEDPCEEADLTWGEVDLDIRTSPWNRNHLPVLRVFHRHFEYDTREEVLEKLGDLAGVTVRDWAKTLQRCLDFGSLRMEETWT